MAGGRWWGKGRPQPKRRKSYNVRDQFDRKYLVVIEIETGDPVQITSCEDDPDNTPAQFLKLDPENPKVCYVDFPAWEREQERALASWDEHRHRIGEAMYQEKYDETKPPTMRMKKFLGSKPMTPAEVREIEARLTAEAEARRRARKVPGAAVAPPSRRPAAELFEEDEEETPRTAVPVRRRARPGRREHDGALTVGAPER